MIDNAKIDDFYKSSQDIVSSCGLEIYDFEIKVDKPQQQLLLFINRPGTFTADLDDCIKVDRSLTDLIEATEWINDSVVLEVSSPGVYRKLNTLEHFMGARGQRIKLGLKKPFVMDSGKKISRFSSATLLEVSEDKMIELLVDEQVQKIKVNIEDIKNANIEPLWDDISP